MEEMNATMEWEMESFRAGLRAADHILDSLARGPVDDEDAYLDGLLQRLEKSLLCCVPVGSIAERLTSAVSL
jgi:hypothetical protein